MILKNFDKWIRLKEEFFKELGLDVKVTKSSVSLDKPSIYLSLDSSACLARITMWASGECQLEIMDIEAEKTIMDKYLLIRESSQFDKYFSEFFLKLKYSLRDGKKITSLEIDENGGDKNYHDRKQRGRRPLAGIRLAARIKAVWRKLSPG